LYVRALLDAYEEKLGKQVQSAGELGDVESLVHLERSRREFYSAEALREFSRDNVPSGSFEALVSEVFDGVIDIYEMSFADGVERVRRVVAQAKTLGLTAHALSAVTYAADRGGMCHQLANDRRLVWRK
jgi:hypothetical protein